MITANDNNKAKTTPPIPEKNSSSSITTKSTFCDVLDSSALNSL